MRAKESHDMLAKMIIIGDSGVGKTNLILSFVGQPFKESYVATIGVDFKSRTIEIEDKKIKLQIWDTAGQERYRTITQTYYKGASAIILTYSLTDRDSFQSLDKWISQINQKAPPGVPKIIVANKSDLAERNRAVSQEQGERLAERYSTPQSLISFRQVSAKNGDGVEQTFVQISKVVKERQQKQMASRPITKIVGRRPSQEPAKTGCPC